MMIAMMVRITLVIWSLGGVDPPGFVTVRVSVKQSPVIQNLIFNLGYSRDAKSNKNSRDKFLAKKKLTQKNGRKITQNDPK